MVLSYKFVCAPVLTSAALGLNEKARFWGVRCRPKNRLYCLSLQAGSLCKELGNENLAFVLLNRYVDLTEAIDEGNASLLDNSDFAEATNVPVVDDHNLPKKQVLPAFAPNFHEKNIACV